MALSDNLDNVWSVSTAGAFGVVRVNRPAFHCSNGIVNKARFVERVSVNGNGDVVLVGKVQGRFNGAGRCAPVFVQFESRSPRPEDIVQDTGIARVALAGKAKVEWKAVYGAQHEFHLRRCGGARGGGRARRRSRTATKHGGNAAGNGLVNLLGTDPVYMRINPAVFYLSCVM